MGRANTRQQLIRIRKIFDALDFIDEYDYALGNVLQNDFRIELEQSLLVAQYRFVLPPVLQIIANPQLAQKPVGNAVIPTARIRAAIAYSDLLKIKYGYSATMVFETRRRRGDQARFAAAIRRKNMGIAT